MRTPENPPDSGIRRILVVLDTPDRSMETIDCAAILAFRLQAELTGLFIEDVNLLRLAALPFAHELPCASLPERRLDQAVMERTLKAQAAAIRQCLATSATRANISWSFEVRRGHVLDELLALTPAADLLVIGELDQAIVPVGEQRHLFRQLLLDSSCSVLVQHRSADGAQSVLVLYDGSPAADCALQLASLMARDDESQPLLVLLPPDRSLNSQTLQQQATQRLRQHPARVRYVFLPNFSVATLLAVMTQQQAGVLVVAAESLAGNPALLQQLPEKLNCDFVLVR